MAEYFLEHKLYTQMFMPWTNIRLHESILLHTSEVSLSFRGTGYVHHAD